MTEKIFAFFKYFSPFLMSVAVIVMLLVVGVFTPRAQAQNITENISTGASFGVPNDFYENLDPDDSPVDPPDLAGGDVSSGDGGGNDHQKNDTTGGDSNGNGSDGGTNSDASDSHGSGGSTNDDCGCENDPPKICEIYPALPDEFKQDPDDFFEELDTDDLSVFDSGEIFEELDPNDPIFGDFIDELEDEGYDLPNDLVDFTDFESYLETICDDGGGGDDNDGDDGDDGDGGDDGDDGGDGGGGVLDPGDGDNNDGGGGFNNSDDDDGGDVGGARSGFDDDDFIVDPGEVFGIGGAAPGLPHTGAGGGMREIYDAVFALLVLLAGPLLWVLFVRRTRAIRSR